VERGLEARGYVLPASTFISLSVEDGFGLFVCGRCSRIVRQRLAVSRERKHIFAKHVAVQLCCELECVGAGFCECVCDLVAWPACITGTSLPSKLPFTTCCASGVWIVIPLAPSIVICRVVDAPFKSPDFHFPANPGPPETRLSVVVC